MQLWRARSAIDTASNAVIKLDDARRALDALAASWRPVGPDALSGTLEVNQMAVAGLLGVSPAPAVVSSALMDGSATAEPLSLILSLPKGKRLMVRAVPHLAQKAVADACVAGLRLLPHFVVRACCCCCCCCCCCYCCDSTPTITTAAATAVVTPITITTTTTNYHCRCHNHDRHDTAASLLGRVLSSTLCEAQLLCCHTCRVLVER
jgi:hypothetical protein